MKMRPSHKIGEPDSVLTIASALAMQPRPLRACAIGDRSYITAYLFDL
jgi:hypothetical protein